VLGVYVMGVGIIVMFGNQRKEGSYEKSKDVSSREVPFNVGFMAAREKDACPRAKWWRGSNRW